MLWYRTERRRHKAALGFHAVTRWFPSDAAAASRLRASWLRMKPLRHQALAVRRLLVQWVLDVPRPHTVLARRCRLRRLLCVAAFNITASCAQWIKPHCSACARTTICYVSRPSGKCRHTSQGQLPSPSSRGSKTGLVIRRPSAFCCVVGCAGLSCLFICCRCAGLLAAEGHFIYRGNVTAQA